MTGDSLTNHTGGKKLRKQWNEERRGGQLVAISPRQTLGAFKFILNKVFNGVGYHAEVHSAYIHIYITYHLPKFAIGRGRLRVGNAFRGQQPSYTLVNPTSRYDLAQSRLVPCSGPWVYGH